MVGSLYYQGDARRDGGFALMMFAAVRVVEGIDQVSPLWITASLLMLTRGELCLSPVGLLTPFIKRMLKGNPSIDPAGARPDPNASTGA